MINDLDHGPEDRFDRLLTVNLATQDGTVEHQWGAPANGEISV